MFYSARIFVCSMFMLMQPHGIGSYFQSIQKFGSFAAGKSRRDEPPCHSMSHVSFQSFLKTHGSARFTAVKQMRGIVDVAVHSRS